MRLSLLTALGVSGGWCLVVGEFSLGQVLLGLGFGCAFVLLTGAGRGRSIPLSQIPRRLLFLSIYLLVLVPYSITRSNLDMARRLLRLKPDIRPGIVRLRLGPVSEGLAALMGHAITMSPGEMVVDYSEDGETMYVHMIDVRQAAALEALISGSYSTVIHRILE